MAQEIMLFSEDWEETISSVPWKNNKPTQNTVSIQAMEHQRRRRSSGDEEEDAMTVTFLWLRVYVVQAGSSLTFFGRKHFAEGEGLERRAGWREDLGSSLLQHNTREQYYVQEQQHHHIIPYWVGRELWRGDEREDRPPLRKFIIVSSLWIVSNLFLMMKCCTTTTILHTQTEFGIYRRINCAQVRPSAIASCACLSISLVTVWGAAKFNWVLFGGRKQIKILSFNFIH